MLYKKNFRFPMIIVALLFTAGYTLSTSVIAPSALAASLGNEIVISESNGSKYSPAIAYNSKHDEYLVVWENVVWSTGHHDIYAQRVSSAGKLLGGEFSVSTSSGLNNQMNPSVAYDSVHDRYLVVFAYDFLRDGSDWDIYGRFIPWNGPDPGLSDFMICPWTSNQRRPVVAYGRTQEEFLVTWANAPSGQPTYISARRVFADGSGFPANPFLVSSGPEDRDFQDVTYNLARNEYLVIWDVLKSGSGLDIYGIRLSATGSALTGGDPTVTGEFPIAGWPANEEKPKVAACSQADQYLVAWQSDQDTGGTDFAIYARYLNGNAVPGNVHMIADTTLPQLSVDLACNAGRQRYLLAWQDKYVGGEYGIWARLAYSDESLKPDFEVAGPRSAADREFPAVAGGRTSFMMAWEHDRDGGTKLDIHGRILRYSVNLPALLLLQ